MKLKMENHTEAVILVASEQISSKDVAILRAGIGRIFQSGRNSVLLDLTAIKDADIPASDAVTELQALRTWASSQGAVLILAGAAPAIQAACQAPTRDAALKKFGDSIEHLEALFNKLSQQIKTLETMRDQVLARSGSASATGDQIRPLRQQNGELRAQISELERLLAQEIKDWVPPLEGALTGKAELAMKIMTPILKQEGILP